MSLHALSGFAVIGPRNMRAMTVHAITQTKTRASAVLAGELRAEMGRQGVTGRELARRLDVPQGWVGRRLGVKVDRSTVLTLDDALEMAEALGLTPQGFLLTVLPRLDSNQQPSGYLSPQVSAPVVDLFTRERVA